MRIFRLSDDERLQLEYNKFFEQVRNIVQQEDQLVNSRLAWNMTFNGFLYATLAAVLLSNGSDKSLLFFKFTSQDTGLQLDTVTFANLIMLAGLASAISTIIGVSAAYKAILNAALRHGEFVTERLKGKEGKVVIWEPISTDRNNLNGMVSGIMNPFAVSLPWSYLVADAIFPQTWPNLVWVALAVYIVVLPICVLKYIRREEPIKIDSFLKISKPDTGELRASLTAPDDEPKP